VAALFALGGCGSDDGAGSGGTAPETAFPNPGGRSIVELADEVGRTQEIVVSPAGQTYEPGRRMRFSFGVFDVGGAEISDAEVALYAAPGSDGVARGPYPARIESLETRTPFRSETTESEAVTVAYVSEINFDRPGEWRLVAVLRDGDRRVASLLPSIRVGPYPRIPDLGEVPPKVHTPTFTDTSDPTEIDTRVPHDAMHEDDFFDVLGQRPVVLLFATPALCMSRVCGPVVDIAEQVHSQAPDDVSFVHMEVYNENDPSKGIRPQLRSYGLQTEPWLFVMNGSGEVTTRIEGAFSAGDLEAAVEKARSG
jgi:hypothetical protein